MKRNIRVGHVQRSLLWKGDRHIRCSHGPGNICCYCGKIFKSPSALVQHNIQEHETLSKYTCSTNDCKKSFNRLQDFQDHVPIRVSKHAHVHHATKKMPDALLGWLHTKKDATIMWNMSVAFATKNSKGRSIWNNINKSIKVLSTGVTNTAMHSNGKMCFMLTVKNACRKHRIYNNYQSNHM